MAKLKSYQLHDVAPIKNIRNILVIAYFYPPHKGIGGKRIAKWTRRLPQYGIYPTVLTTPPPPAKDSDFKQPISFPDTKIVREYVPPFLWKAYHGKIGSEYEPESLAKLIGRIQGFLGTPIDDKLWMVPFAIRAGKFLQKTQKFDAILSTSSPYSSHLIALILSQMLQIPFFSDFRDPWSFNFLASTRNRIVRSIDQKIESLVLKRAKNAIFASKTTQEKYESLYPGLEKRAMTVYSGFEPLPDLQTHNTLWPEILCQTIGEKPRLLLVHFGRFYGIRRLGKFLDVLSFLKHQQKLSKKDIGLLVLGEIQKEELSRASLLGIEDLLYVTPMLPYEDGLMVLQEAADILLLFDYDLERYFVPGKFFDYLSVKKPILAISANNELRDLIVEHSLGKVFHPQEEVLLRENLELAWKQGAKNALSFAPKMLEDLSTEKMVAHLAQAFLDSTTEKIPGAES